ncbi:MAG: sigma-70 family RNA polymerase sigma factor [Planctomycetes bacterium]|nr:sigma-70 family RNA polymerase sigma factor [Planctomycetota bacterium]
MAEPIPELVKSAIHGDSGAAEKLLERNLPQLEAFVRLRSGRRLLAKESASDIVQSVCREVLMDIGELKWVDESHFKFWLFTNALRKISNRHQYWSRERRDIAKEIPSGHAGADASGDGAGGEAVLLNAYCTIATPSKNVAAREEIERIETVFDKLPDRYREIILLSKMVGLTHPQIAEKLEMSESNVRVLLFRALARLSELLSTP